MPKVVESLVSQRLKRASRWEAIDRKMNEIWEGYVIPLLFKGGLYLLAVFFMVMFLVDKINKVFNMH